MHQTGLIELEAAISVARHRNFRAAAEELGMSRTAISNLVRGLEARIGVLLFQRTTRSVALTAAGEMFINRVSASVADISEAIAAAQGQAGQPTGTLRINSSITAGHEILSPLILEYLRLYPTMKIDLITDSRFVDIVLEGFDAGIRLAESVPGDMVAVSLGFSLDFSVVGSPDYLARHPEPATPDDLMHHECIRAKWAGSVYRWGFERGGKKFNLDVPGALTLDEQSLTLKAAVSGLGLAFLSDAMTREAVAAAQLRYVLRNWRTKPSPLALYYPRNRHTPAALRAFIELVRSRSRKRRR
jgi:DNA-binding transcriptional LysR family regulator